jgi:hypothetical protein
MLLTAGAERRFRTGLADGSSIVPDDDGATYDQPAEAHGIVGPVFFVPETSGAAPFRGMRRAARVEIRGEHLAHVARAKRRMVAAVAFGLVALAVGLFAVGAVSIQDVGPA